VQHIAQKAFKVPFCVREDLNLANSKGLSDLKKSGLQHRGDRATGPGEKAKRPIEVEVGSAGGQTERANDTPGTQQRHADVRVKSFLLDAGSQVARVLGEGPGGDGLLTALYESRKSLAPMEAGDLRKGFLERAPVGGEEHVSALRLHQEQF
jgi:hypothetical protein